MNFIKNIFKKLNGSTTGSAIVIAIFSILSKILGLLRDRILASRFGAGDTLDAYYAAFKLPDLIFNTLVLGALSAAFIPVFIELKAKKEKAARDDGQAEPIIEQLDDEIALPTGTPAHKVALENGNGFSHWDLSASIINIITLVLIIFGTIVWVLAPQFVELITPGFNNEKAQLTIELTRIMLISILFFGISNVFGGILQASKRFLTFAMAPVVYNLGIILGAIFLVDIWGERGLAWGVVFGALLHLLVQYPTARQIGFHWRAIIAWKNKAVRQVGELMLPRTIGLAANQINQLIITVIASGLISGSLAVFNLAFNLGSVPISIFAVSLAIATFPVLSESFALKNKKQFVEQLSLTARRIIYLMVPISVFMIALRAQLVRLILGSGSFDWEDTILTAESLGYFSVSLFAQGLVPLLARAFYAFQNTKIPVLVGLLSMGFNIIISIILAPIMGVAGLALALSLSSIFNFVFLAVILRHKVGNLQEKKIMISTIKICISALGALIFIQLIKYGVASMVDMRTFWGIMTQFLAACAGGIVVYLGVSAAIGSEEVRDIKNYLFIKINKDRH